MQDASSKEQMKQKYKPNHQQTGVPPHAALTIRGKTKTQHKSHPIRSTHKPLDQPWRAETKRRKEFNLLQGKNSTFFEAWEKETSNTITKKKNEKAEKYCTNEGT